MALHRSFCLFVVVTLYGVCQAQCVVRTLVPMTMLDTCTGPCGITIEEPQSSCSADDLSAVLMLARALEMDRAASANKIDVNGLLNTLVHALVYTATHNSNSHYSGYPPYTPGHPPYTPGHPPTGSPSGSGGIPTSGATKPTGSPTGSGGSPTSGASQGNNEDLSVYLLGADKPNVAEVDLLGLDIGVGLGDTSSQGKGKGGGGVTGLLGSLLG